MCNCPEEKRELKWGRPLQEVEEILWSGPWAAEEAESHLTVFLEKCRERSDGPGFGLK
jgi:hypothetical protein